MYAIDFILEEVQEWLTKVCWVTHDRCRRVGEFIDYRKQSFGSRGLL